MAFRSFAVLSVLATSALAQSQSNPLIPAGISQTCSTFLYSLDTNPNLSLCASAISGALSQVIPGANTSTLSSSAITTTLDSLCVNSVSQACPQNTISAQLSSFYAACSNELTTEANAPVKQIYDIFYSIIPLVQAMCSKDDSGKYCAISLSNSSTTTFTQQPAQAILQQNLYSTVSTSTNTSVIIVNATTFRDFNLAFLLLSPSASSSELCVTCTRNILTPYITFESNCPYASGISASELFSGQTTLYNNITSKCGANFLSGAVQAAGGLSGGELSSGAPRVDGQELSTAVGAIIGAASLLAAFL